jgi:hypothetical protein
MLDNVKTVIPPTLSDPHSRYCLGFCVLCDTNFIICRSQRLRNGRCRGSCLTAVDSGGVRGPGDRKRGTVHSKLILLRYEDRLRVIISSANFSSNG